MQAVELLETRRSIRKFTGEPISRELIEHTAALAANAPSWKNTQTASYICVCDPVKKSELAEQATMTFSHNRDIINSAPALVVLLTCDGISGYEKDGSVTTSKGSHWQSFDAGIAAQTFCLAAHELGLGTVILGIYSEDKVRELLEIPDGFSVSALIPIGYADEQPEKRPRKSVGEILKIV